MYRYLTSLFYTIKTFGCALYLFDEMGMIIVNGVYFGGLGLLVLLFEEKGCFAVHICVCEEDLNCRN